MSKKTNLYMMVGLVGSGKTSYAEKLLSSTEDCILISSDTIREELLGDVNDQTKNNIVFDEMIKRTKDYLWNNTNVIYDATNITRKSRASLLCSLGHELKSKIKITAIIMAVPFLKCLVNNSKRERNVPFDVIDGMYKRWCTPMYFEGFDEIRIIYDEDIEFETVDIETIKNKYGTYDQCNKHHTMSLGDHMVDAYTRYLNIATKQYVDYVTSGIENAEFNFDRVRYISKALLLHDIGKPYTHTFINIKTGNKDEDAHYYQHHCVGSYDSLFYYSKNDDETLIVSWLIGEHMYPYLVKENIEVLKKYKKKVGGFLYDMVMVIHECDKESH